MLNTPSDSATTKVVNISQVARYIKAPAEAAQGEASQCWGGSGNSSPAEAAGRWLQQPAGPAGQGGEDAEEGAGQVPHHQ